MPEGGAGRLTAALVERLRSYGGRLECGTAVARVLVRGDRAVGVRAADGREISAARAILATAGAPALFRDLVGEEHLPSRLIADLRSFQYDNSTVKVDWSLEAPIPWTAADAHRTGTVHVAHSRPALSRHGAVRGGRRNARATRQGDRLGCPSEPRATRAGT